MADRKITDLTALAAGSQATGDLLTIVDVSEAAATDKNKKITVESLFKGIPSNVGIGTSSPSNLLHLNSSDTAAIRFDRGGSKQLNIGTDSGQSFVASFESKPLAFATSTSSAYTERMRIDSSGKVGVGTTSPDSNSLLTVNGVINLPDDVAIAWGGGSNRSSWSGNKASGFLRAYTNGSERMRIDSSGNVGIGTTSPSAKLHVSSTAGVEALVSGGGTSGDTVLHLKGNGNAFKFLVPNAASQYGMGLYDVSNSTYRMFVDSSGQVGIGATSPDRKLEVVDTNSNGSYPLAVSNFINATANKGAAVDFRLTTGGLSRGELGCKWVSSSASDGTYFYFAPNNGSTGNVQRLRIDDDGLKFNSDTAAANALDDYEEGTWTPTTYSDNLTFDSATYVKIGRMVTAHCSLTGVTSYNAATTNPFWIFGFPFTTASGGSNNTPTSATGACRLTSMSQSITTGTLSVCMDKNNTRCRIQKNATNAADNFISLGDVGTGSFGIVVNVTYYTT